MIRRVLWKPEEEFHMKSIKKYRSPWLVDWSIGPLVDILFATPWFWVITIQSADSKSNFQTVGRMAVLDLYDILSRMENWMEIMQKARDILQNQVQVMIARVGNSRLCLRLCIRGFEVYDQRQVETLFPTERTVVLFSLWVLSTLEMVIGQPVELTGLLPTRNTTKGVHFVRVKLQRTYVKRIRNIRITFRSAPFG